MRVICELLCLGHGVNSRLPGNDGGGGKVGWSANAALGAVLVLLALANIASPAHAQQAGATDSNLQSQTATHSSSPGEAKPNTFQTAIQHIVFIIKENRSFNEMFGAFPGADGATRGLISTGQVIPLGVTPDVTPRNVGHTWYDAVTAIDNGRMDQYDLISYGGACSISGDYLCMSEYVQSNIPNYYSYASSFTLADQMFSSMTGPSFPNHLYTIAAQAGGAVETPPTGTTWGCDADPGSTVALVDASGNLSYQFPCFDFQTLADLLQNANISSWTFYSPNRSPFNSYDAINHIRNSSLWTTNFKTDTQFATDASAGNLPSVSWVIADENQDEHPSNSVCAGENWTVNQLNAVMQGSDWSSTAVFVTWDDFGGFYDAVAPQKLDGFGLGPRVGLLIVSPYAKPGFISHTIYEFSSFLKFVEDRYGLPSLTARDANANDMQDSFDFNQNPNPPLILQTRHCPPNSTPSLNFPSQQVVGTASPSYTVTLTNFNTSAMAITQITTSGDFSQTNNCPASLVKWSPGVVDPLCTVTVTFTPTATGTRTGTLTMVDGDSSSPQTVSLTGVGTEVSIPTPLLSFGKVTVGSTSATQSATVTNSGNSNLQITTIKISGDYSQTNNCGTGLQAVKSCTITVSFTPTTTGTRYGTITVTDSDASHSQVIGLTGIGTSVSLTPSTLSFGTATVGGIVSSSMPTFTNNGTTAITVSNITVTGTDTYTTESIPGVATNNFGVQSNTCGGSVAPGASCTITVDFTPTIAGALAGQLFVFDNQGDSPQSIALSGTGQDAPGSAVPFLSQPLSPASVAPGGAGFTVTVKGAGFVSTSNVDWNGVPLSTSFLSSTKLTATVTAADVAAAGTALVTVSNPAPGGGASNFVSLPVTHPISTVAFTSASLATGTTPQAVAAGDFNGDGKLDLVVANQGDNTVTVFPGNGNGTFGTGLTAAVGDGPVSLAVGDFNGDGTLDLAVADATDSSIVTVLLGNGDGTLTFKSNVSMETAEPVWVGTADFNGDGKLDLAVVSQTDSTVSVFLGNGDGTFDETSVLPNVGIGPVSVAIGDFNGDGKLDLAVANFTDGTVGVLTGNGDGTFKALTTRGLTGNGPQGIVAADFNGDGKLDLAVTNSQAGTISVLLGNGDGTFQTGVTDTVDSNPQGIGAADVNGDGSLDLVVANQGSNTISVLLGSATGTFGTHTDYASGGSPVALALADYNRDGLIDAAVADSTAKTVSILTGSGIGGGPAVTLAPTSLTFATQLIHTSSTSQNVTLTNSGSATLNINSISITGTDSTDYTETNTCGSTVIAGASCTISVTFDPRGKGTRSANVSIADNATGSPQSVPLAGTGTIAQLSPASLTFGSQMVGTTSAPQVITLSNQSSNNSINISSISVAGTNSGDFAETNNCGSNLAAGASCTIDVTFTPKKTGARTATLQVKDNAGGLSQTATLSGTGM